MNHWKMADLWNTLMTEALGYPKYAAGGADYGALVTAQLGHKYADNLYGVHFGMDLVPDMFNGDTHWSLGEIPNDAPPELRPELIKFYETYASHVTVHMLDAQTADPRVERLPGRHARLDPAALAQMERQERRLRGRLRPRLHPH